MFQQNMHSFSQFNSGNVGRQIFYFHFQLEKRIRVVNLRDLDSK